MERLEPVLLAERPDWLVVYGDINSTMAAALVASKIGVRIAHVEAGLRSGDRTMPEEINRIVTDRVADLLLTPSHDAGATLRQEGVPESQIAFVGNVMIDSLMFALDRLALQPGADGVWVDDGSVTVTLHRPSNVDDRERLASIVSSLRQLARTRTVHFPAHPRTTQRLAEFSIATDGLNIMEPLGYDAMVALVARSHAVVTDSGGLQEETTALGIPCFTLRPNTERPATITEGTNRLVGDPWDLHTLVESARRTVRRRPDGWDGRAADRIVAALEGNGLKG
jgi:UDP-N-acetylglucosamine 2-epimerase (non-hydrolysing)